MSFEFISSLPSDYLLYTSFIGGFVFLVCAWLSTQVSWSVTSVEIVNLPPRQRENLQHSTSTSDSETLEESIEFPCDSEGSYDELNDDQVIRKRKKIKDLPLERQEEYCERFRKDGHIVIKLKQVEDTQRFVHAEESMLVKNFKLKYFYKEIYQEKKRVRLIFLGKELCDKLPGKTEYATLKDYKVQDYSTVHYLISKCDQTNRNTNNNESNNEGNANNIPIIESPVGDFEFGNRLFIPIFCLLLASSWLIRITYCQYFSAISTISLVGLTIVFALFTFAMGLVRFQSEAVVFINRDSNGETTRVIVNNLEPIGFNIDPGNNTHNDPILN